jgi:hypothetical protein
MLVRKHFGTGSCNLPLSLCCDLLDSTWRQGYVDKLLGDTSKCVVVDSGDFIRKPVVELVVGNISTLIKLNLFRSANLVQV